MTAAELTQKMNNDYGLQNRWPPFFEVDHETYANACQIIFDSKSGMVAVINLGLNKGLMFKGVELILEKS